MVVSIVLLKDTICRVGCFAQCGWPGLDRLVFALTEYNMRHAHTDIATPHGHSHDTVIVSIPSFAENAYASGGINSESRMDFI
jgi:hypothetical protein